MEAVNKEQAEKCRDLAAQAIKDQDWDRAIKFLLKAQSLYAGLPGVEGLLARAYRERDTTTNTNHQNGDTSTTSTHHNGSHPHRSQRSHAASSSASASASTSSPRDNNNNRMPRSQSNVSTASNASNTFTTTTTTTPTGPDGRPYTPDQVEVVQRVLRHMRGGGRGTHYRVLELHASCNEAAIKKAYRKLALKLHPDKNAAPHAAEAFKAVGLAYATLSDTQKRSIYDRYGDVDPDNQGGRASRGGGMYQTQDVNPEDIFNMFFGMNGAGGGGAAGGFPRNGGVHVFSTGFGPGVQFRMGGMNHRNGRPQNNNNNNNNEVNPLNALFQLLPVLLIMLMSFYRFSEDVSNGSSSGRKIMPGEFKYFTLTHKHPFVNHLSTQLSTVKDIPFYVTDRFIHTYYRNRQQLFQVETMVENAYEQYLVDECTRQREAALREQQKANKNQKEAAAAMVLTRCEELKDLFPRHFK